MSEEITPTPPKHRPLVARILAGLIKAILPLLIIAATIFIYRLMMNTAPQADRSPKKHQASLVEVAPAKAFAGHVRVEAHGLVKPAQAITLSSQVSGEVIKISEQLIPGGRFKTGDVLLKIDPRNYEYAVQQSLSALTQERASLTLEVGNRDVALREYEVLGQKLSASDQTLVFREPQLESAKAKVAAAEARLEDARLDLIRTAPTAPFDALVVSKNVDLGSRLTIQSDIAHLVGYEVYWVELSIPQTDLHWIQYPTESTPGSTVILRHPKVWGTDRTRSGRVLRLLPELSAQGRMARLLIAVDDPLALTPENLEQPPLLIGQYLEADILGKEVRSTIQVHRAYLHDGDNIWVMSDSNTLEIRHVDIAYRGIDFVLVAAGLTAGEPIIITDLPTATDGMPLRTAQQKSPVSISGSDKKDSGK